MKTAIIGAFVFLQFFSANAQVDKAKEILDGLSAKTKTYKTISASFTYTLENTADDIKESQEGKLITKGESYKLVIGGQQIICNGKTIWTFLEDVGEVQLTNVPTDEEKEEEEYISPTTIFTLYEKGFKYKYVKDEVIGGKTMQLIHLFPMDPDQRSYHTIKLYVDKAKTEIALIKIMGKDGTTYTYDIKSFQVNQEIPASTFTFNKSEHPGVDVIDMR